MNFDNIKPLRVLLFGGFGLLAIFGLVLFARFPGFDNGQSAIGNVLIWGTLPKEAIGAELTTLVKTHPEFGGVVYEQHPEQTFGADLAEALAVDEGPDMVLISQEELLAERNKLSVIPYSSISQRSYLDSFLPITELFLTDKGTYGIPVAVDPLVMYYNRTLLGNSGISQPPTTWEAVMGMSDRVTDRASGPITRSLLAFGEYDNITNARAIISLLLLQAGSPITQVNQGTIHSALTYNPNGTGNPAQSALSFYTQFSDPAKTVYSWNRAMPDARQAFLAGNLALYFGYASELPIIAAGNPNLDFDMAPVPQPQKNTARITYGLAYALAIPKTAKNPQGAFETAVALSGRDVAPATAGSLGMVPALRAALVPSPDNRFEPVYFPEALVARGWLSPSPAVTDSIFAAMITNITSGRRDIGQALQTASQALDSAL